MIRGAFISAAAMVTALLCMCTCGRPAGPTGAGAGRPKPVFELAAQSRAWQVRELPFLPGGPGASGQAGDFLLENALVRFVVAGPAHAGPGLPAGNVIDAAVQGGEDRMRLLSPLIGPEPPGRSVYTDVLIENPGGSDVAAVVTARGHLLGRPLVSVVTEYALRPDSASLEMATTVENASDSGLTRFGLRDVLYHGRTRRFVPGAALAGGGKKSASTWMSFFWEGLSWGIVSKMGSMDALHDTGASELRYATVDIPPGGRSTYRRSLVAAVGGSEKVWQAAYPLPAGAVSRLLFAMEEVGSGQPVKGAEVRLIGRDAGSPVLLVSDPAGRVETELEAGPYVAEAMAPGRPVVGRVPVRCMAGKTHRLGMAFAARAEASMRVRATAGDFSVPAPARVACYRAGELVAPFPLPPAFPVEESAVALSDGVTAALVPLVPASADLPASWVVVASKGPLYDCAIMPVVAQAGRRAELDVSLQRVVDPGEYVSADLRQHTEGSLDCALTVAERALANACEGLDVAVVSDHLFRTVLAGAPRDGECRLLPGLRLEVEGVGAFSVYPLDEGTPVPDLRQVLEPGRPAAESVAMLRRLFPDAVVQVDSPLHPRKGYFALSGWVQSVPASVPVDFDAIEVLSGSDVPAARTLLRHWFSLLNSGRRVMVTGGSGSRAVAEEVAGTARTFYYCPRQGAVVTAAEGAAALRRLRTAPDAFVTNGPFLQATLNGQPIGSVQTVRAGRVRMQFRIVAPLWVDVSRFTVYRNGRPVEESVLPAPTTALRCERVLELEAPGDCWFVLVVEGRKPMSPVYPGGAEAPQPFAVTNPFWVDTDGDGGVTIGP